MYFQNVCLSIVGHCVCFPNTSLIPPKECLCISGRGSVKSRTDHIRFDPSLTYTNFLGFVFIL